MGPDAGKYGGIICYEGTPKGSMTSSESRTGTSLRKLFLDKKINE